MKQIGIIGLGWLGTRLANAMTDDAKIYTTTRNSTTQTAHLALGYYSTLVDFDSAETLAKWDCLHLLDTIIITIPLPTRKDNQVRMHNILSFIKGFKGQVICCSSTGIYPNEAQTYVETDVHPINVPTEAPFVHDFPQSNILRLGGLMGYDRYLSKYNITQGLHEPVNHVHADDVVKVIQLLIQHQTNGAVLNIVAPLHPPKSVVLAHQRGEQITDHGSAATIGRMISSALLIDTHHYTFIHPDPTYF